MALAIYTLAGIGFATLCYLLSKAMLKGYDAYKARKTLVDLKAKWSKVEVMQR